MRLWDFLEIFKNRIYFDLSREVCDMPAGIECGDELDSLPWFFHTNNSMNLWRTIKLDNSHCVLQGVRFPQCFFLSANQYQNITLNPTTFQI